MTKIMRLLLELLAIMLVGTGAVAAAFYTHTPGGVLVASYVLAFPVAGIVAYRRCLAASGDYGPSVAVGVIVAFVVFEAGGMILVSRGT
jgi:hypothetical protein